MTFSNYDEAVALADRAWGHTLDDSRTFEKENAAEERKASREDAVWVEDHHGGKPS